MSLSILLWYEKAQFQNFLPGLHEYSLKQKYYAGKSVNLVLPPNPPTKCGKLGAGFQKFVFVGKCLFAKVTSWAWASRRLTWGIFWAHPTPFYRNVTKIERKYFFATYCPKVFCCPPWNNISHQGNIFWWGGVRGVGYGFSWSLLHPSYPFMPWPCLLKKLKKWIKQKMVKIFIFPLFQSIKRCSCISECPYKS